MYQIKEFEIENFVGMHLNNVSRFNSTVLIEAERNRLRRQRVKMEELSQILGERIAAFDPDVAQKEALAQLTAEAQETGEYD